MEIEYYKDKDGNRYEAHRLHNDMLFNSGHTLDGLKITVSDEPGATNCYHFNGISTNNRTGDRYLMRPILPLMPWPFLRWGELKQLITNGILTPYTPERQTETINIASTDTKPKEEETPALAFELELQELIADHMGRAGGLTIVEAVGILDLCKIGIAHNFLTHNFE